MSVQPSAVRVSRRHFLGAGLGIAGAAVLTAGLGTPALAQTANTTGEWTGKTSANGWPIVGGGRSSGVETVKIEGSNVPVTLRSGDVAAVLLYVARRFHYEIGALEKGGVTGHTTHRKVAAPYESNYLSGTAIAIRPDMYPVAAKGGLFPREEAIIRDILAQCDGVVRWGGDDKKLVKESHFQIDVRPGDPRLHALAAKLTRWSSEPGRGAGSGDDPFAPRRVAAARALQQRQKASA